jgi:uncharacterized protein YcfJ
MKLQNRIIGAIEGATIAFIIGQLGPQAGLPEEIITVPAAAVIGFIIGNNKIEKSIKLRL